jgi:azurin
MSQNHPSSATESSSIWSIINTLIAAVFALGLLGIVGSFIWAGIVNSVKMHSAKPAVATTAATGAPAAATPAVAATPAAAPVAPVGPPLEVTIKPDTANPMMYNTKEIIAKPGQHIKLTFDNKGAIAPLPHNIVVGQAGTKDRILALAMQIMTDPNGMAKGYIPEAPEVLAHTKLVNAGSSETIEFNVGAAGDYPYMCTFPGHSLMMNGTIKVQ